MGFVLLALDEAGGERALAVLQGDAVDAGLSIPPSLTGLGRLTALKPNTKVLGYYQEEPESQARPPHPAEIGTSR